MAASIRVHHRQARSVCKAAVTNVRSGRRRGLRYAATPALPPCAHVRHGWQGAQRRGASVGMLALPLRCFLRCAIPLHFAIAPLSAANTPTEAVTGSNLRGMNFEAVVAKSEMT